VAIYKYIFASTAIQNVDLSTYTDLYLKHSSDHAKTDNKRVT